MLAGTGIPRTEASALAASEVDFVSRAATIRARKGRRFRTVPAPFWSIEVTVEWFDLIGAIGVLFRHAD